MARTSKSSKKTKKATKAAPKSVAKKPAAKKAAPKKGAAKKPIMKKKAVKKAAPKAKSTKAAKATASPAKKLKKLAAPTTKSKKSTVTAQNEKVQARHAALARAKKESEDKEKLQAKTSVSETVAPKKRGRKSKAAMEAMEGLSKLGKKWAALYRKAADMKVPTYTMRGSYEEKSPIQHKVLGWGYILSNKNDRLEVLFKDGIRFLISNYKA